MKPRSLLITHPWMGRGGSEATAVRTLQAFQDVYDVTFVTASPLDWDLLNDVYDARIEPEKIRVLRAPGLPGIRRPDRLAYWQYRCFERFCQSLAPSYDLCISAYNPLDFGKPGIQLLGDFSFSEKMRSVFFSQGDHRFLHKDTLIRRTYLALGDLMGVKERSLRKRGDLLLSNSYWTQELLKEHFDVDHAPVIYPPVILPKAPSSSTRDELGFVCMGRIVPEKEIERVIRILQMVRAKGYPVRLSLLGDVSSSLYGRSIGELAARHGEWISARGFLSVEPKQEVLATNSFGLHAAKTEAFGIAVAEMASMGCVPLAPATGGVKEIVSLPELQYQTDEEAVDKIIALINNPEKLEKIRKELPGKMDRFAPEVFMSEIREWAERFSEGSLSRNESGEKIVPAFV